MNQPVSVGFADSNVLVLSKNLKTIRVDQQSESITSSSAITLKRLFALAKFYNLGDYNMAKCDGNQVYELDNSNMYKGITLEYLKDDSSTATTSSYGKVNIAYTKLQNDPRFLLNLDTRLLSKSENQVGFQWVQETITRNENTVGIYDNIAEYLRNSSDTQLEYLNYVVVNTRKDLEMYEFHFATDIVISQDNKYSQDIWSNTMAVIEIKTVAKMTKNQQNIPQNIYKQAILQLTALHAKRETKDIFAILTDLNSNWYLISIQYPTSQTNQLFIELKPMTLSLREMARNYHLNISSQVASTSSTPTSSNSNTFSSGYSGEEYIKDLFEYDSKMPERHKVLLYYEYICHNNEDPIAKELGKLYRILRETESKDSKMNIRNQ